MPQHSDSRHLVSTGKSRTSRRKPLQRVRQGLLSSLSTSLLLLTPTPVLAGGGHDHGGGFKEGGTAPSSTKIEVEPNTAKRMGLKVEPVSRQQLPFGIQANGQIEALPSKRVQVTNPTGGTVLRLFVEPGDTVQAGQPLALLSSPDLATLRVDSLTKRAEAEADVQQAEADLRLAQQNYLRQQKISAAEVQQAKIDLNFSQEKYDRDRELLARGAIPRRQVLESETQLAAAKSALAKAESRLQVSEAEAQLKRAKSAVQVAQSRVELSSTAYLTRLKQLGATPNPDGTVTVTAPISGTVANRDVSQGESAQDAGKALMTIVDGQAVLATANIYEKDLEKVTQGQPVRVTVASLPNRTFSGRVTVIGSVVEGEARVVPVKAEIDNARGTLKPGMFARIEVVTDRTPAAVVAIPRSAIVEVNQQNTVYVQNGNAYEAVTVELGRTSGDWVEVKKGLFDGDMVVTQRANQLYAQSLLGGSGEEEHSEEKAAASSASLPWWSWAGGGALAVGTFVAGLFVASRWMRPSPKVQMWQHPQVIDGLGGKPVVSMKKPAHDSDQQEEA